MFYNRVCDHYVKQIYVMNSLENFTLFGEKMGLQGYTFFFLILARYDTVFLYLDVHCLSLFGNKQPVLHGSPTCEDTDQHVRQYDRIHQ